MYTIDPGYADQLACWGLDYLVGALAFPAQVGRPGQMPVWKRLGSSSTEQCYRIEPSPDEVARHYRPLYLKVSHHVPPTWRYVGRASRASREAANLRALAGLGVHCPRIIALGERREAGPAIITAPTAPLAIVLRMLGRDLLVGTALILTAIEPSLDLAAFAEAHWRAPAQADDAQRRQIARLTQELSAQLVLLHARRFVHRDLKFRNLLVCWPQGQRPGVDNLRIAWIDCPRGGRMLPGPWLEYWRVYDLYELDRYARRYLSRTQRLRFLRDYLLALGGTRALRRMHRLARRVLAYDEHLRRKNARRRRRSGGPEELAGP
ncbi:MAG: hypothetical protein BIFFINMI_03433 [Phycisphaerae bacterium]|nr:hypothetical protein [Phycisphaerae bacterium]